MVCLAVVENFPLKNPRGLTVHILWGFFTQCDCDR